MVKRPGWARLELWCVVVLAEPRGPVAVILENLADGGLLTRHDAVVDGITSRLLGDDAKPHRMVVAPGDQRHTSRRTQCG